MKNKVWFITGASQGFGLGITKKLLEQGHQVAATTRNPQKLVDELGANKNLLALKVDLSNQKEIDDAVAKTVSTFGSIDILLNNAGYGQLWTFEESTDKQIRECFEVNFFGTINVTRSVLPVMRKQKYGHIFTTSSIWGYVGVPYNSTYAAVKFATDGWTESISHELKPFGITVSCIKPGGFRTNFLSSGSLITGEETISDYKSGRDEWFTNLASFDKQQDGDPERYCDFIIDITKGDKVPPVHIFTGRDSYEYAENKIKQIKEDMEILKTEATDLHVR
ncbi:dehydrogenase [Mesoplasma florum L1]|uniref:Dehydrogenase n=2 Tax=Mesoplasma florum TaxID=2151 RepID=Q6F1U3_MESFL|nr:SDR family oxidoreductase [Mesoplasma florum]AAT75530.1 dehydrogenase [Mesoplasma florum L1]AGY41245.1 short-chain dehydrogenase reductase SDR [Mesoplasma florum W37]ATI73129.1 oxidoreductase [Mesoplasma florum]ATI73816.1 oxidoreductase [Mesoplasma florum]AVN58783.1 oxidoreductase [Mesoplasma florum]